MGLTKEFVELRDQLDKFKCFRINKKLEKSVRVYKKSTQNLKKKKTDILLHDPNQIEKREQNQILNKQNYRI